LADETDYPEDRGLFLLDLYRKASSLPENELYKYFLDHAVKITQSEIGFFHFVDDDQKTIALTAWNKEALNHCTANSNTHYPISQAGNWADSIRLKQPIIYNNFKQSPNQKGLPEGHTPITRMLSFPLIEDGKIHAVFGVGNKKQLYQQSDVAHLELISSELNKILKQRAAEGELRKSKEMYSSLFSNMIDGFAYCKMIFNESGKPEDFEYLQINEAFERITGLRREAVVGKRASEAIPGIKEDNPELFEIYGRVAVTCQKEKFEIFFKPLQMWLSISVYCPEKGYFVAVFEDITEHKQLQKKLEDYAKHLETLVEEKTKELKAAERLAGIGAAAAMVGHDIRNPLQAIICDVYLLKKELDSLPDNETKAFVQESLDGIESNLFYINKIVADLQDFARVIIPSRQQIFLEDIIETVLFKRDLPLKVEVTSQVDKSVETIFSDPDLIKRMLNNLITNSLQAMPNGGKLNVHAYSDQNDVIIEVKDTGIGIPEEARSKMFTPMFTTKSQGQGFGLSVVKRMTEALGGTVTFESKVGGGTKFIVSFPAKKAEQ